MFSMVALARGDLMAESSTFHCFIQLLRCCFSCCCLLFFLFVMTHITKTHTLTYTDIVKVKYSHQPTHLLSPPTIYKQYMHIAERGFDPRTFGLWAQRASHCATPLRYCVISGIPTSSTSDTGPPPAGIPPPPPIAVVSERVFDTRTFGFRV